jgi:polyphosphate glucokinase
MSGARTLAVDVGGTGIKAAVFDAHGELVGDPIRVDTAYPSPPDQLVAQLQGVARMLPAADRLGVGFPGLLRSDRVVWVNSLTREAPGGPVDDGLAREWVGFHLADALADAFGLPVRVANDADVAALACVTGRGLECMITLGTGLGFSLVHDGRLLPHLELDRLPLLPGRDFEDVLGLGGLESDGQESWTTHVRTAVDILRTFVYFDHLYVGGGNARLLVDADLGADVTLVDNVNGLVGGYLLWRAEEQGPAR